MGFGQIGRRRLRRDGYRNVSCEDMRRFDTSFPFRDSITHRARETFRALRCASPFFAAVQRHQGHGGPDRCSEGSGCEFFEFEAWDAEADRAPTRGLAGTIGV